MTRVVFDTNTVVSALLFGGALSWLVEHWRSRVSVPLVSRATAGEFLRVLHYPKFGLSDAETEAGHADVLVTPGMSWKLRFKPTRTRLCTEDPP